MKRIYQLFKNQSLVKQLIILLTVVLSVIGIIMIPLVNKNLNRIIAGDMYSRIKTEQQIVMNNAFSPYDLDSGRKVYHLEYDVFNNTVTPRSRVNTQLISKLYFAINLDRDELNSITDSYEQKVTVDKETYYYVITKERNGVYLLSFVDSQISSELIVQLRNQIIYIQYFFFICIGIVIILWVFSLINPLKRIKEYIDNIKLNQKADLIVESNDEIGEVSGAITDLYESLKFQEKAKEEMIHNISHDLKTPIALIKTYSESVKDDIYPYGDKNSSMDVIIENAERLEHKVKSLLYLNRLDYLQSEKNDNDLCDMGELIHKVIIQMQTMTNLTIESEVKDVMFRGSLDHWRIAIENIIENALRYAKTTIKITLTEEVLEIYNDGEPINQDMIPYLFDPYVKGVKGQFGLGLSIVSKIVKLYNYDIQAVNKEDGVSFIIKDCMK